MIGHPTLALVCFHLLVAVLAVAAQDSSTPCTDPLGVCTANAELLPGISEHTSTDHLSYVQLKASKMGQIPDNVLKKAEEERHATKEENPNGYTPPPPDDFTDTFADSPEGLEEEAEAEVQVHSSHYDIEWAFGPKAGGIKGPSNWGEVAFGGACAGPKQSPINIASEKVKIHPTLVVHDLELIKRTTECNASTEYILNEYTIERLYPDTCGHTFEAIWREKSFFLKQFHYHSPSEHMFEGAYYPMEVHHVHKSEDGQHLIIAVMVAALTRQEAFNYQDKVAGDFMASFVSHVPQPHNPANNRYSHMYESELWDPYQEFLKGHLGNGFFQYEGSLGIPPCTTGTLWFVDPVPINVPINVIGDFRKLINKVQDNQLVSFLTIFPEMGEIPKWANNSGMNDNGWSTKLLCNNRPIQPLGTDRTLWAINVTVPELTTAPPQPGDSELATSKDGTEGSKQYAPHVVDVDS